MKRPSSLTFLYVGLIIVLIGLLSDRTSTIVSGYSLAIFARIGLLEERLTQGDRE